ncbi:hypothetical protein [Providencia stuartii]|uniref:hypothetical protein n=1 Tax=Providencia stuartii TaxID=588 RepID=UPI000D002EFD|nr:hypothetical protein [Providencia stuartii]AVL39404.1 hypothetical protein CEP70_05030 [Providencia stuartii]
MSHEIELSVAAKKSAQLNAVLFQLNSQFVGDPVVDSLIELAYELSNPVAGWLIEENAQRDNDMNKTAPQKKVQVSECMDVFNRVKAFLIAAQYLNRDNSEKHIASQLIAQCETEVDDILEKE